MVSHTPEQEIWAQVYERFDPEKPAQDKAWRVERAYSPAKDIVRELGRPMGGHKRFMILTILAMCERSAGSSDGMRQT